MGALRGSFQGGGDEAQGDVPDLDGLPEDEAAVWQGPTKPPGARAADLCGVHGAFLSCDASASSSVQLPSRDTSSSGLLPSTEGSKDSGSGDCMDTNCIIVPAAATALLENTCKPWGSQIKPS